ncbi:MAG: PH domain-containing protein [Caldilineaceae bacterium]
MQSDAMRAIFQQTFQRTLANSGVQFTALPPEELNALVDALAESTFAVLEAIEEESAAAQTRPSYSTRAAPVAALASDDDPEEQLIWKGRPYLSIGIRYELTTERLRIIRGLLGQSFEEIELVRVRDTKVKQHMGERALNVGDITIYSNDPTTPEFVLNNVPDPIEVRELIRKATLDEKRRRGLAYREEM